MDSQRVFIFEYRRRGQTNQWDAVSPGKCVWTDGEVRVQEDRGALFISVRCEEAVEKDDATLAEELANKEFQRKFPGHKVHEPGEEEPTPEPQIHHVQVQDHLGSLQGIDLDKANSAGQLVEDLSYREDPRRHGTIRTEHTAQGQRVHVSGEHRTGRENTRADKLAEENDSAAAFANDLSQRTGRVYAAVPKEVETGAFPDVWLQEQGSGERVGVEFTHFDKAAISQPGQGPRGTQRSQRNRA